eukprot:1584059-Pyramimonas_sp.AAC.2
MQRDAVRWGSPWVLERVALVTVGTMAKSKAYVVRVKGTDSRSSVSRTVSWKVRATDVEAAL